MVCAVLYVIKGGMVHMKDPLLLTEIEAHVMAASGFLSRCVVVFDITVKPYNRKKKRVEYVVKQTISFLRPDAT